MDEVTRSTQRADGTPILTSTAEADQSVGCPDWSEAVRLAAVVRYDHVDAALEQRFSRIVSLAARAFDVPMATVTIIDGDRIRLNAPLGFGARTELPRERGLSCATLHAERHHVVQDAWNDPANEENHLVHGPDGVRFYAGSPIRTADGAAVGTVDVFDVHPKEATEEQLATLVDLASIVMDELELRLSTVETLRHERELREQVQRFASTMQRTLLPPALPEVTGMDLACHYYAASRHDVTGDFYDVFFIGDGRWAFFLGDVSGHGAPAATVTSLTRYTLRTAALHNPDPAAVLGELNEALLRDPNVHKFCTVLFGHVVPASEGGFDVVLAGGGHPPAFCLRPGDDASLVEIWPEGGMLVGALPDAVFATTRVRIHPGQTLLLYTDGLTESRRNGEFFGEHQLREYLMRHCRTTATELISALAGLIDTFDPAPSDDVALLAMSALE